MASGQFDRVPECAVPKSRTTMSMLHPTWTIGDNGIVLIGKFNNGYLLHLDFNFA
jgi:hypothetical protein